jgi:Cu/Zn superoxide dismutase
MRSILAVSALLLAACDENRNDANQHRDQVNAANDRTVPPNVPGDAGHPMGRPDMPPDHPPMGHDMGRGEMGRDAMFRVDPSDPNSAMIEELVATVSGDPAHKDIKGTVTFRMQGGSTQGGSMQGGTTLVDTQVSGLPKGEHGYHVHVYGDCSDLATKSPGEHLDFHAGMAGMGGTTGSNMPNTTGGTVGTTAGSGTGMGTNTTTATGTATCTTGTGTSTGMASGSGTTGSNSMGTTSTDMVDANGSHVMGNLGELTADASGRATGSRTVDARLRQLLGRAVVIHEKGNDDTKPDGAAGTPIACGVIGIANPAAKASASKEPEQK